MVKFSLAASIGAGAYAPVVIAAVVIVLVLVFFSVIPVGMWISAVASGVRINIFTLLGMKIRRVRPARIVAPMIKATKAGIKVKTNELEAHYLAGGNVDNVINALIAAERAGITLTFEQASAIDLAGRDVFEAVLVEERGGGVLDLLPPGQSLLFSIADFFLHFHQLHPWYGVILSHSFGLSNSGPLCLLSAVSIQKVLR